MNPFFVLALDGGGTRGAFSAQVLKCLQEKLEVDPLRHFGIICGTSTGSILAASIACQVHLSDVVDFYKDISPKVFRKRRLRLPRVVDSTLRSTYDIAKLENQLREVLGDIRLGELSTHLLIPATDVGNGGVHVFKSGSNPKFTRDQNVPVYKAVTASCAAPTYFNPVRVDEYLLADGGLWANNPALVGALEAIKRFGIPPTCLKVLSVGTGGSSVEYKLNKKRWGIALGWEGVKFIDLILSLQSKSASNYLGLILDKKQVLRLNFSSEKNLGLDRPDFVDDCISKGSRVFSYRSKELNEFLGVTKELS